MDPHRPQGGSYSSWGPQHHDMTLHLTVCVFLLQAWVWQCSVCELGRCRPHPDRRSFPELSEVLEARLVHHRPPAPRRPGSQLRVARRAGERRQERPRYSQSRATVLHSDAGCVTAGVSGVKKLPTVGLQAAVTRITHSGTVCNGFKSYLLACLWSSSAMAKHLCSSIWYHDMFRFQLKEITQGSDFYICSVYTLDFGSLFVLTDNQR